MEKTPNNEIYCSIRQEKCQAKIDPLDLTILLACDILYRRKPTGRFVNYLGGF